MQSISMEKQKGIIVVKNIHSSLWIIRLSNHTHKHPKPYVSITNNFKDESYWKAQVAQGEVRSHHKNCEVPSTHSRDALARIRRLLSVQGISLHGVDILNPEISHFLFRWSRKLYSISQKVLRFFAKNSSRK
jgi:hypothetical protein